MVEREKEKASILLIAKHQPIFPRMSMGIEAGTSLVSQAE